MEKLIKSLAKRMPWLNVSNDRDDGEEQNIEVNCETQVDSLKVDEQVCEITSSNQVTNVTNDQFLERVQKLLKEW